MEAATDRVDSDACRAVTAFVSMRIVRMWIGPSFGSRCEMCGQHIAIGEIECDALAANGVEHRLGPRCYRLLLEQRKPLAPVGTTETFVVARSA